MVKHTNFYETVNEARMRLRNTIVMYRDVPYWVVDVADHDDGRFRIYMDELGHDSVGRSRHGSDFPHPEEYYPYGIRKQYDKFIENNPDSGFIRKLASSKHFNNFRPFPLGNVNTDGNVVYTERSPTRNMHQGLLSDAVVSSIVTTAPERDRPRRSKPSLSLMTAGMSNFGNTSISVLSPHFADMLVGNYPSFQEVIDNLRDPHVLNRGCAFDRDWSVLRGPIDTLCLCYKHEGVGLIDHDDVLQLGSDYQYLYESISELGVFNEINIKKVKTRNA